MNFKKVLMYFAYVLMIVGSLNWGLVALCDCDLVKMLFPCECVQRTIYCLVGLAGVVGVVKCATGCCSDKKGKK